MILLIQAIKQKRRREDYRRCLDQNNTKLSRVQWRCSQYRKTINGRVDIPGALAISYDGDRYYAVLEYRSIHEYQKVISQTLSAWRCLTVSDCTALAIPYDGSIRYGTCSACNIDWYNRDQRRLTVALATSYDGDQHNTVLGMLLRSSQYQEVADFDIKQIRR